MPSKLFIHATNVHQGGGAVLLNALLGELRDVGESVLSLDERMQIPVGTSDDAHIKRVKPTLLHRWAAELWLARSVNHGDVALCFGNLPPLFRLSGHTVVFLQNRYLIDDMKLTDFPIGVRLRLLMERQWLSRWMENADEFIVQTPTMKRLLERKTGGRQRVRIVPFMADVKGYARHQGLRKPSAGNAGSFIYGASGEPHKNHRCLMEAWSLLADEGIYPVLRLTLDENRFAGLWSEIEAKRIRQGLKVENIGVQSHQGMLKQYAEADALIYPSTFESFGLPLIEARQANLPVLAPELDYVRDVLDPEQTFDPESPVSIARAVKRFMGIEESVLPVQDAKGFLAQLVGAVG